MDELKIEQIKEFAEMIQKSKVERNGYIMMPSIEGFKLYEINEDRLKLYIQAEVMFRKANVHVASDKTVRVCPNCEGSPVEELEGGIHCPHCDFHW